LFAGLGFWGYTSAMQKRIFLGISLPEDIKKRLFRFTEKEYKSLPVGWVRKENYHLTLNFLGYVQEEKIPEICEKIRQAAENSKVCDIEFLRVETGPNKKIKRLIWLTGEKNSDLAELKNNLDRSLGTLLRERKDFVPHITLGRLKKREWENMREEPAIEKEFQFSVPVSSVELLESKFEKGKRVYYVLESFPLR